MAAVAELSLLLITLINSIPAEEPITILKERDFHIFKPPGEAKLCLISRFVGEEKLVLWNTSDLLCENSTVPKEVRERLSFIRQENSSSYIIHNLTHSDSGLYQVECWTKGNVTYYEKNISIAVCSIIGDGNFLESFGETILPCKGKADNRTNQWIRRMFRHPDFERHFGMQCVSSHSVTVTPKQYVYRSIGETAVLHCPVNSVSDDKPPHWMKYHLNKPLDDQNSDSFSYLTEPEVKQNFSLVLSSLMLNHTGVYACNSYTRFNIYYMVVCPTFRPPAIELFSEADEVTIRCNHSLDERLMIQWFMKTELQEDTITAMSQFHKGFRTGMKILHQRKSLVLSNVSLEDRGEYWCAVIDQDLRCHSAIKTLLIYREPFGVYSTFYAVRTSVVSGLLVMLCAVVVAVIHNTRRGKQGVS